MINKAFSLIELMVVVAIIAVLAAIAVPSFQQYYARTQVSNVMPIAQSILQDLQQYYATHGSFPSSYTIGGTSFSSSGGNWTAVSNVPNISGAYYMVSSDGLGIGIALSFTSLLIPTFSQGMTTGNYNNIYIAMRANSNGIFNTVCGQNGGSDGSTGPSSNIPFQYLPRVCTCAFAGVGWPTTGYMSTGSGC